MIRQRKLLEHQEVKGTCAEHFPGSCWVKAAAVGFAVGLLNGFFGVGGGFMIVTALALSLGFPTRLAIGTSLSIIAVIALAGIAGHLGFGAPNGRLTVLVVLGSVVGMLLGTRVARLAPASVMNRVTASITVGIAFALIVLNTAKVVAR